MRTATVTWITYNNYGTELQAYALQRFLLDSGFSNDIIFDLDIVYNPRKITTKEDDQSPAKKKPRHSIAKLFSRIKKYALHPILFCKNFEQYCENKYHIYSHPYFESQDFLS